MTTCQRYYVHAGADFHNLYQPQDKANGGFPGAGCQRATGADRRHGEYRTRDYWYEISGSAPDGHEVKGDDLEAVLQVGVETSRRRPRGRTRKIGG